MEEFYIEEDDEWIENIEKEDDLYKDFYLEKNDNITLNIIYVNRNNNIEHIKKEKYFLNDQMISKTKKYNFFKLCKTLDEIKWKDTINLFKDINSLYLIYYEKKNRNNTTKKVYLSKKKKNKNLTRKMV